MEKSTIHSATKFLLLILFALCFTQNSFSATTKYWRGAASTAWATAGNWSTSSTSMVATTAPANGDLLVFNSNSNSVACNITTSVNFGSSTITFDAGYSGAFNIGGVATSSTFSSITMKSGGTLTITASTTFSTVTLSGTNTGNISIAANSTFTTILMNTSNTGGISFSGARTLSATAVTVSAGTFNAGSSGLQTYGALTVNGGTYNASSSIGLTVNGTITASSGTFNGGSAPITVNGVDISGASFTSSSATMTINNGNISFTGGTFTHNGGTVVYNITSAPTVRVATGLTFKHFKITSTSNNLNFNIGSVVTIDGTFTVITGNTINLNTGTFYLNGDIDVSNFTSTSLGGNGAIIIGGSVNQNFAGSSGLGNGKLTDITISKTGGTLSLSGNINIDGNLTWTSGSVDATSVSSTVAMFETHSLTVSGIVFDNFAIGDGAGTHTGTISLTSTLTTAGSLSINSQSTLTTNNHDITVGGDITNGGTLTCGTSTFTLTGTKDPQSIALGSYQTIYNLTADKPSGTALLVDGIQISHLLTVTSGIIDASGYSFITFLSTGASTSAQIATIDPTVASLTGNCIIQRYIPAGNRAWRFLASPVSQDVASSWQQNIFITGAGAGGTICDNSINTWPSYTSPVPHSNGFDATITNSPSMYTYHEPSSSWVSISGTNGTNLTPGVGYRVAIRGNRDDGCVQLNTQLVPSGYTPSATTLSATGTFSQYTNWDDVDVAVTSSGSGWNLVGNPYQATIDWNDATWASSRGTASVAPTLYNYKPLLTSVASNYATYNNGVAVNGGSRYISPGQSFFVYVTGAGNITFKEAYKATSQAGGAFYKTNDPIPVLYAKFNDVNSSPLYEDETAIAFRSSVTRGFDADFDAKLISFTTGNIRNYNTASSTKYAINSIPTIASGGIDTVYLEVAYPSANGSFSLSFRNQDMPYGMHMYLIDRFTSTMVNITGAYKYSYNTTSSAASRAANRFMVIFADNVSSLPVVLSKFGAEKTKSNSVDLSWTTSSEINNNYFEVQRSTIDQNSYVTIGEVAGKGNSIVSNTYSLIDPNPSLTTTNYYRLKQVDLNNKFSYSPVVAVDFYDNAKVNSIESSVHVFPVPANDMLNITLTNSYKGDVTLNVYTMFGDLVKSSGGNFSTKSNQITQDVSNLSTGVYLLEVVSKDGSFKEQTKFIKE